MVYAEITVLTPSYICLSKIANVMYQLYMHLYAKIGNMILILQEQASFKRTYKKLAHIGKYLYKLCVLHNKLCKESVYFNQYSAYSDM